MARTIPSPMPRKLMPVDWMSNPWPSSNITGNAWNAKYRMPSIRAVLLQIVTFPTIAKVCRNTYHKLRSSAILSYNINSDHGWVAETLERSKREANGKACNSWPQLPARDSYPAYLKEPNIFDLQWIFWGCSEDKLWRWELAKKTAHRYAFFLSSMGLYVSGTS
jgi:hypothetical protein